MSIEPCPNCASYRSVKHRYKWLAVYHNMFYCERCGLHASGRNMDEAMRNWNRAVCEERRKQA